MNVLKTISLSIEILTLVLSLVACSGGGSSSTTPPPVVPVAPPTTTQPTSPSCSETVTEGPFDSVFPSVEWEVRTPESQGICSDGFDDVVDYAFGEGTGTASFLIIKNGYLIFEEYADDVDADTLATSWSVAKSIVSTTVGTSIDDGYISNTDIFASTHLNEWDDSPKDQITLYHLLSLRTGLAQVVATDLYFSADMLRFSLDRELIGSPGEVLYDYSNADVVLTGELVTRAVDEPISTYFQHRIGDRIGLNSEWWYDAQDTDLAYCCIDANPREFCALGITYGKRRGMARRASNFRRLGKHQHFACEEWHVSLLLVATNSQWIRRVWPELTNRRSLSRRRFSNLAI